MAELTYRDAVARGDRPGDAARRPVVFLGEDVAGAGGVFKATVGLLERVRPASACVDTPISEQAILGAAMGAAMTGLRPIAEIMFADFFAVCWDIVANEIAKSRYMTDGQVTLPAGDQDRQRRRAALRRAALAVGRELGDGGPGPQGGRARRRRADVIGLFAAAVRDRDPVLFFEHKGLYASKGEVPDGEIVDTLGTAKVLRDRAATRRSWRCGRWCRGRSPRPSGSPSAASRPTVDRRAQPRAAGHADHPARGRKTGRLFTVEENPRLLRLGRRDRVDRRRGVLLGPRRARTADHHAAHPAAVGGRAGGSGAARRRSLVATTVEKALQS